MTRKTHLSLVPLLQQRLHAPAKPPAGPGAAFGVLLSFAGNVDGELIPHLIQMAERTLVHAGSAQGNQENNVCSLKRSKTSFTMDTSMIVETPCFLHLKTPRWVISFIAET